MIRLFAFFLIAGGLLSCRAQSKIDPEAARVAIDSAQTRLERFVDAGQADSVAASFTQDGWQMPPNMAPLAGRDSIVSFWRNAFQWGKWDLDAAVSEVTVADSLAIERGTYNIRFTAAGAQSPIPSFADRGNHVTLWRRESDGRWRIQWDAIVSTQPAAGAPATGAPGRPPR